MLKVLVDVVALRMPTSLASCDGSRLKLEKIRGSAPIKSEAILVLEYYFQVRIMGEKLRQCLAILKNCTEGCWQTIPVPKQKERHTGSPYTSVSDQLCKWTSLLIL